MDQVEASGKTVDDAYKAALAKMNVTEDDVEMVVLDEGQRAGIFGRSSRDAVVRIQRIAPEEDEDVEEEEAEAEDAAPPSDDGAATGDSSPRERGRRTRSASPAPARRTRTERTSHLEAAEPRLRDDDFLRAPGTGRPPASGSAPAPRAPRTSAPRSSGSGGSGGSGSGEQRSAPRRSPDAPPASPQPRRHRKMDVVADINAAEVDLAAQALDDILQILDIDAQITIREPLTPGEGAGSVRAIVDISGEDLGVLIGRRGDTLSSLQHLVNLIVTKRVPDSAGVAIDVEHYRHRREEQFSALAERMADRVRRTGSPITLEPMTAADRRIIHLVLAEDGEVQTYSIGEGDARKVVISSRR